MKSDVKKSESNQPKKEETNVIRLEDFRIKLDSFEVLLCRDISNFFNNQIYF